MVGVDPALVLCYRDEYREVLGEQRGDFSVQLVHEWLQKHCLSRRRHRHKRGSHGTCLGTALKRRPCLPARSNGRKYLPAMVLP